MKAVLHALRRSPMLSAGIIILLFLVVLAVLAPFIAPYRPGDIAGDSFEAPSSAHLLGTNDAGGDNLSRLLWGARSTLVVTGAATAIAIAIGAGVGLAAGLRGGWVDTVLMRVVDLFLALPVLPLLIVIAALAGPSVGLSIVMVGLTIWPLTARVVRSQALTLRTRGFVQSARGFGAGTGHVVRRHLLPALGPVILANAVYIAGMVVAIEAGLAFIGLADPEVVSWGGEINRAATSPEIHIGLTWVWALLPAGLLLMLALVGFTIIGVALEPRLNPRWRHGR